MGVMLSARPQRYHPFDGIAPEYDSRFTHTLLGRWMREAVWRRLDLAFRPGDRVLELGCGTGEDALWLAGRGVTVLATDASAGMLAIARQKLDAAGMSGRVTLAHLDLETSDGFRALGGKQYDGAFSNFGALNCLADRGSVSGGLAGLVRKGGRVLLVLMGRFCLWEILWYLGHGQPQLAFRRLLAGVSVPLGDQDSVRTWYPTPRELEREFGPEFRRLETVGIGCLIPPSYLNPLAERWPSLFRGLAWADRRLSPSFPWNSLSDHYLTVLERR